MNVLLHGRRQPIRTVAFDAAANAVVLIDQRQLPHRFVRLRCRTFEATARAIRNMTVRGAGAIGATAAFGLAQGARAFGGRGRPAFDRHIQHVAGTLAQARPTAVDPANALRRILQHMDAGDSVAERQRRALEAAQAFAEANVAECRALGEHGRSLIRPGLRVLTHCNAGWLAFVDIGSATAPLYAAHRAGVKFHVYCDETRPRLQGASLTAWELAQEGISHEIIADNAAGHLMARGEIDLVIVGSDRVLAHSGDVANKIGTYTKAVLAARHGIPFHVAIPYSTLDWQLKSGAEIPIEERDALEVLTVTGADAAGRMRRVRVANPGSGARNPGFDVTPGALVTEFVTPLGRFTPAALTTDRALRRRLRQGCGFTRGTT